MLTFCWSQRIYTFVTSLLNLAVNLLVLTGNCSIHKMASNCVLSRRPAASYSNEAFEPDISIASDQPMYSVGGAFYYRN